MTKERVKGFTLVELMVVMGIIALLMGILMPVYTGVRERARQRTCGQSMASIGRGMMQYSNLTNAACLMLPLVDSNNSDPCVKIPSSFTGTNDPNIPLADFPGGTVNAMQNFWLMLVQGMCQENHFQCPSDEGYQPRKTLASGNGTDKKYGWTSMNQFSFGVQWCYSSSDSNNKALNCDPTTTTMDEAAVIMADRNPGGSIGTTVQGTAIKPSNHPKDGENVMVRGGGVKFYGKTIDSAAGREGDDIYVNNTNEIKFPNYGTDPLSKKDYFDTVIVPGYAGDKNTGR